TYTNNTFFAATTGKINVTTGVGSSTAVSSLANPSTYGNSLTFTAIVTGTGGSPSGTVQFKTNGVNFGSAVALSVGSANSVAVATLAAATYTVTAVYSGDDNFNTSTGTLSGGQTVNKATPTVTVTVGTYTYTGSAQGPNSVTTAPVSTGSVTYSYVGVSLTYGPNATRPTLAGNYTVTATVAADANNNQNSSSATAFS